MDTTEYEDLITSQVEELKSIATEAREKKSDPKPHIESDIANDIAERCEKLLGIDGLQELIISLDDEGYDREEMAFKIAEELAEGNVGNFENDDEKIEAAIRTAVALLTEGVVAAPIDGIGEIRVEDNDDGTQFIRVPYFGPIRSAGGTGQALSVLVADHIRQELNISEFKPRDDEVHRYVEEMQLYEETTGLQYTPKEKEVKHIIQNCPIMVDGVQTEQKEVAGYRDLERIEGNRPRGGMCLVVGEGIAQKAPKIQRYVEAVGIDGWEWIDEIVEGTIGKTDDTDTSENEPTENENTEENDTENVESDGGANTEIIENTELAQFQGNSFEPSKKFKADALGGRPIFSDASEKGAFRLRYGRSRNTGLAASGFNPASMVIVDKFIATGTQLKTERPGKAQGAVPVTTIEGPLVKLYNGEVTRIQTEKRAENLLDQIDEILDLGEILITHGEFLENNHDLAPAPWTTDWWYTEYLHAGGDPTEHTQDESLTIDQAIKLSNQYEIPLHPHYTYYWSEITPQQYQTLSNEIANTKHNSNENTVTITLTDETINTLEDLGIEHTQKQDNKIEINENHYRTLNLVCDTNNQDNANNYENTLEYINNISPIEIRKRVTLRIGTRMGRPEKAKFREMDNKKINALFPVADAGQYKDVLSAAEDTTGADENFSNENNQYKGKGVIETSLPTRKCPDCNTETWQIRCPDCNTRTNELLSCYNCNVNGENYDVNRGDECPDPKCSGNIIAYTKQEFNINQQLDNALDNLEHTRKTQLDNVKAVEGLSSATKILEPLEKGLLRSKHDLGTFRDGTTRYDMVDLPLTHFKPKEINLSIEKAHELGYTKDIHGDKLTDPTQTVELQKQDMIIADRGAEYMLQVANYIDELLEDYYHMDPYYNAETIEDLQGHLVAGLAPHTSAAVIGRLIGHTNIKGHYAHPVYHAAKRRNCFHPNTKLTYKLNGEWKQTTIQHLVETHLTENADDTYTDGSIVQHIKNQPEIQELKVPSMTNDGHRTLEPVTALSKHEPTDKMITITFDDGEELTVTPDHNIPIKPDTGNNTFQEKQAKNIHPGDTLYDYNNELLETVKNYPEIDVLKKLIENKHSLNLENVMIRGMNKEQVYDLLVSHIKPQWDDGRFYKMKSSCEHLGITKKTLDNYLRRESIPISLFQNLYDGDTQQIIENIPRNVTIGINSDNTEIPRFIDLDEELATLLGYYTAEGFTRHTNDDTRGKNTTGVRQVDFAATEDQARTFIENTLEKKFNVENAYKEDKRITASGTLITYFFDEIVNAGRLAHTKEVPELIKKADNRLQGAYLSGYISGDGSYKTGGLGMYTVSETLKNDLQNLIRSLGHLTLVRDVKPRKLNDAFPEFYDPSDDSMSRKGWNIRIQDGGEFIEEYGVQLSRKQGGKEVKYNTSTVKQVEVVNDCPVTYNLTVDNTNKLEINGKLQAQCDGDEDSIMLLLDGFLNFSEQYLPDRRGARSMDSPLLMTSVVDPDEIDDEAHNVTTQSRFPLEFYYKTQEKPGPKDVDIPIIEDMLEEATSGERDGIRGVGFTTETEDIGSGPFESRYNELEGMDSFVEHQLELATRTRAIDESMVASKVIDKHLLPDILGNLNAFTKTEFMCNMCHSKFKFPPFNHQCPDCGGGMRAIMNEGMVTKYVDTAIEMGEKYEVSDYMQQRLNVLSDRVDQLFENDKNKQSGLDDFM